ncbi:hypothetical protein [Streptomyces sp. CS62]|uniref:hypothetical protein n=1 Tax=Streptomyces sp. CS62 TaxID=3119268 RepID=UPI002F9518BA
MHDGKATIIVSLSDYAGGEPSESWVLTVDGLDMTVDETLRQLQELTWATKGEYPVMSSLRSRQGVHDWGASSAFVEFILDVSASGVGALGAVAFEAAVRDLFSRFRSRSRGDYWGNTISEEDALAVARRRVASQYGVEPEELSVQRAEIDAVDGAHDFRFSHADGRTFGAVVGILRDSPTCMRIWREEPSG